MIKLISAQDPRDTHLPGFSAVTHNSGVTLCPLLITHLPRPSSPRLPAVAFGAAALDTLALPRGRTQEDPDPPGRAPPQPHKCLQGGERNWWL